MGKDAIAPGTDLLDEPALLSLAALADRLIAGQHAAREGPRRRRDLAGDGGDFLDHQPYGPGNDPRFIDWRASARTGQIQIRRQVRAAAARWYVILDSSASMGVPGPAKWMLARRLAAAFLFLLLNRGNAVGVLTFADGILGHCPAGRGRAQLVRAMATLAATTPIGQGGASRLDACLDNLRPRDGVIVVSDFLRPDGMAADLLDLRRACGHVHALQVLGSEEAVSGGSGGDGIRDAESGEVLPLTITEAAAESVRRRLAEHVDTVRRACRSLGISFTPCPDTQDWRTHVVQHLRALRPGHS